MPSSLTDFDAMMRMASSYDFTATLHDLVDLAGSMALEERQTSPTDVAESNACAAKLSEERRGELRCLVDGLVPDESLLERRVEELNPTLEEVFGDPVGFMHRALSAGVGVDLRDITAQLLSLTWDEQRYVLAYGDALRRLPRSYVLLQAVFLYGVTCIEPVLAAVLRRVLLTTSPTDFTGPSDPKLERKVRSLNGGGPTKWRQVLVRQSHVTAADEAIDWEALQVLWAQRDVMAHRAGVTDNTYLAVDPSAEYVGLPLSFDPDTIHDAIDRAFAVRLALAVTVWVHLEPPSTFFGLRTVTELAGMAEDRGRWLLVEELYRLLRSLQDDHEERERLRVTLWLARERRLGPLAIVQDVEGWDVSEIPPVFSLAKLILLHRDDEAIAMTKELLTTGELAVADVERWLLFARFRDSGVPLL